MRDRRLARDGRQAEAMRPPRPRRDKGVERMSQSAAFLFPGQGAQHVGMGADLASCSPAAREIFEQADEILGIPLSKTCFEGPEERLNATDIAQPAIYTMSLAALAAMRAAPAYASVCPTAAAGLSLGEYTALHAAGVFDFATGLRIVRQRGLAMQAAADAQPSSMVAVMGLDRQGVEAFCAAVREPGEVLSPANYNAPGQIVISGHKAACLRAVQMAEEHKAKATELAVAGAFHSALMAPAVEALREALQASELRPPGFGVVSNVTGRPHGSDVDEIRRLLCVQCAEPIRWEDSMRWFTANGHTCFFEVGPGRVLSGLLRRIDRSLKATNISTAANLAG